MSEGILIRCDGSSAIGLGHVVRCLGLAEALRDGHRRTVTFAVRTAPLAVEMVRDAGFDVIGSPHCNEVDDVTWLTGAATDVDAETLVVDIRDGLQASDLRKIRERVGVRIAVIDDISERRLAADEVFLPPVPQTTALAWSGFEGRVHIGWEWVLLRREFAEEPVRVPHDSPVVLVTMGGSDPMGLTLRALNAVARLEPPLRLVVLVGPAFAHGAELETLLGHGYPHPLEVVRDGDVRSAMVDADMAILSFGVTAYEAAACGLPAVHLCITDDHARSSSAFAGAGLAVSLGLASGVGEAELAATVERLLADRMLRRSMGTRSRLAVDGGGADRIAKAILTRGRRDRA